MRYEPDATNLRESAKSADRPLKYHPQIPQIFADGELLLMALLCETGFPEALDIKACHAGIKKVSELLGIDIDLGRIENEAARFDEGFKKYLKDMQEKKRKDEDLSYIG